MKRLLFGILISCLKTIFRIPFDLQKRLSGHRPWRCATVGVPTNLESGNKIFIFSQLLILFLFSFNGLKAQLNHFIYIQTENNQAFYLKLDKKLYSSTASGYMVVPKLKDGTYNLAIGFPKSEWPEQNIKCTIDNNDNGYLLKNFKGLGWGLINLQTSAVILGATDSTKVTRVEVVNKTDAFSNMLSTVVNDSSIRQTEVVKEDLKKPPLTEEEKTTLVVSKESDSLTGRPTVESLQDQTRKSEVKEAITDPGSVKEDEKTGIAKEYTIGGNETRSVITRSLFNRNAEGTEMVYTDESKGKTDTIRVFIPVDKNSAPVLEEKARAPEKAKEIEKPKEWSKSELVKKEEKDKGGRFLQIDVPNQDKGTEAKKTVENTVAEDTVSGSRDTAKIETTNPAKNSVDPVTQKTPMINSDCKSSASGEDFLKLRKKMAAKDNDDDMIALAKKLLKAKCFTVEQVKNLSVLFLKDPGKYAFFDMAYPFVSDSHNYSILQNQLSETYYINRFQSMIHH